MDTRGERKPPCPSAGNPQKTTHGDKTNKREVCIIGEDETKNGQNISEMQRMPKCLPDVPAERQSEEGRPYQASMVLSLQRDTEACRGQTTFQQGGNEMRMSGCHRLVDKTRGLSPEGGRPTRGIANPYAVWCRRRLHDIRR